MSDWQAFTDGSFKSTIYSISCFLTYCINVEALVADGWRVLVVWECQMRKEADTLPAVLRSFVEDVH